MFGLDLPRVRLCFWSGTIANKDNKTTVSFLDRSSYVAVSLVLRRPKVIFGIGISDDYGGCM